MKPAHRISDIAESIFATMTRLAFEHKAVNLGQGFPDFDGPQWIVDDALAAMRDGRNQYAPMPGVLSLRESIASYRHTWHGQTWDPASEITVTAGATEALFSSMLAFLDPGDEVLLFEPFYDSYQANVLLAGAVPVYVTLHRPDFTFDPGELEARLSARTRMIIVNTPHNPTGKVFSKEELEVIAEVAQRRNLLVLSDEVYEFLVYDNAVHVPIASLPGMRERTITVSSTGKTFGMTGWKIGYAMAAPALTHAIRTVHQFVTFAVNTPAQHAMASALPRLDSYLPGLHADYARKRDMLCEGLAETPFAPHIPRGSYFVMADLPPGSGEDDITCATRLVREAGVAVIPPSVFYASSNEGTTMLRFCFAKKEETIRAGLARLRAE